MVAGYVAPLGVGVLVGASLFGVGMQIGGACASGTLYAVGSGHTAILLTLAWFVVGATVGAAHIGWWEATPSLGPVRLADSSGGPSAAWPSPSPRSPRWRPPPGGWVGAVALAVLNLGVLLVSGAPLGVTTAFALWGSKAAGVLGVADPSTWGFWSGPRAEVLSGSVLAESTSLTNFGIMIGPLIASALAGAFTLHRRVPARLAAGAVIGGLLMGYGARPAEPRGRGCVGGCWVTSAP